MKRVIPILISLQTLQPKEVVARCNAAGLRVVETGIEHGTVLIVVDEVHVEVTTLPHCLVSGVHTTLRRPFKPIYLGATLLLMQSHSTLKLHT